MVKLTSNLAAKFAMLAMAGIRREFPNKPGHIHLAVTDSARPRHLHPVFFGCFDWHSAVHTHWTLVRLVRVVPHFDGRIDAVRLLREQLTPEKLQTEANYFSHREHQSFERMYGWAWALALAGELHQFESFADLRAAIEPLENRLVELVHDYLPRLPRPIRSGTHSDTGFALSMLFDYAEVSGKDSLQELVTNRGVEFYRDDKRFPFAYEPSGEDFFSSGLNEADFMRRVLARDEFACWYSSFLPDGDADVQTYIEPVVVDHPEDGRLAHLAGLNLSRAWTLAGIAGAMPPGDQRQRIIALAGTHLEQLDDDVFSGCYEGEHWLGTFAVYALTTIADEIATSN